eukprot:TRINITY_DN24826_c0_g1_i1.p1 TRINITY_DN24826_c0_g1~~TRINITY_DN24826_c0_g1_i1.p1  ORF type:complete len:429 (+),score=118.49 TRINITY_DN24826_c0_g1_i1:162-1448(+)
MFTPPHPQEALIDLVDVDRGIGNDIFTASRVPNGGEEWIHGVRVGNKRRLISTRGCFALVFRVPPTAKDTDTMYKALGLMSLKPDTFSAWVPGLEAIRSIVSDKRFRMPTHNQTGPGHFSTGLRPGAPQPERPVSIKAPPGHGMGNSAMQPAAPVNIKQAPAEGPASATNAPGSLRGMPRCKALLISVSYEGTRGGVEVLRKAHSSVSNCSNFLLRRAGWEKCDMRVLQDTADIDPQSAQYPSRANIIRELQRLTSEPDSVMFLCYAGHGRAISNGGADCIVPADHAQAGVISQDDVNAMLLNSMKPSSRLVCLFDVFGGSGPYLSTSDRVSQRPGEEPSVGYLDTSHTVTRGSHSAIVVSGNPGESVAPEAFGVLTSGFLSAMSRVRAPPINQVLQTMVDTAARNRHTNTIVVSSSLPLSLTTPLDL